MYKRQIQKYAKEYGIPEYVELIKAVMMQESGGRGLDPMQAAEMCIRDRFITVKEQYQKTEGIQAYHGYLSFKETDISPEMAQKIGMEFANEVWGKRFQVVVTTHLNTKHLHCHFVINSISFVDGKHLWGEEKAWFKFRKDVYKRQIIER